MKKLSIIAVFIFAFGCGQKLEPDSKSNEFAYQGGISVDDTKSTKIFATSAMPISRMLIKTGQLSMQVDDVKKSREKIGEIAQGLKAYISEERLDDFGDRLTVSMMIRVPSPLYDSLVVLMEHVGEKTESKSVNTQDVTEEFIDTEARLKTKKELETRYREILRQAQSVTDILSVESQLNNVRGEIESMEGRLKYLSSQVAFSTLNLSFYQSLSTDFGFIGRLGNGLRNGWTNLLSFFIGLANVWPFLILCLVGVRLFFWWKAKRLKM
jgi:hypothetical protein